MQGTFSRHVSSAPSPAPFGCLLAPRQKRGSGLTPTLPAALLPSGAYLVFPPQSEEIPEGWSHEDWSRAGWSPG